MGIVTCDLAISRDGYSAGPNQSLDHPFGDGVESGETLHTWMFDHAENHRAELAAITAVRSSWVATCSDPGAVRGTSTGWDGGARSRRTTPRFVLTHLAREPLEMAGGTTFPFVTGGPDEALELARTAAADRNVAITGGATTINQYLAAGAIR